MSKDDAFTPSDELIELTDIVEQGTLPEAVDEKSDSAFEQELDALFGEADLDAGAATEQEINPNEELEMPDMSDLDSLLGDIGAGESDPASANDEGNGLEVAELESVPDVEGVDELLADLIQGADADDSASVQAQGTPTSEGFAMDDSDVDDLDALLAEIGNDAEPANISKSPSKLPNKMSESIASEVDSVTLDQAKQERGAPASPPDDLDELFAELEGFDEVVSGPENAKPDANPDAKPDAKPDANPDAKLADTLPADSALQDLNSEADDTLSELDALIDDIMSPADVAPAKGAPVKAAPAKSAAVEVSPAEVSPVEVVQPEVSASSDGLEAAATPDVAPDVAPSATELAVEAELSSDPISSDPISFGPSAEAEAEQQEPAPLVVNTVVQASSAPLDLDFLAKELASGPLLAAMQTIIAQEVDKKLANQVNQVNQASASPNQPATNDDLKALVQDLVNQELEAKMAELEANLEAKLNAGMDKATAAAAARIIREEIAALAEVL